MTPKGKIPKVGDEFHPQDDTSSVLKVKEVGAEIRSGDYFGAAILADDDIWYDCFWSFKNNRFQYFTDDEDARDERYGNES